MSLRMYDFCAEAYARCPQYVKFEGTDLTVLINACAESAELWRDRAKTAPENGTVTSPSKKTCEHNCEVFLRVMEKVSKAGAAQERRVHSMMEKLYRDAVAKKRSEALAKARAARKVVKG